MISPIRIMDINNSTLQKGLAKNCFSLCGEIWISLIRIMDITNSGQFIDVTFELWIAIIRISDIIYSTHLLISIVRIMVIYNSNYGHPYIELVRSILRISDIHKLGWFTDIHNSN